MKEHAKKPMEILHFYEMLISHERLLLLLGLPALARIRMLEDLGFLPAIPSLPGAGAHVFSETRYLLKQEDAMNGEHCINAQVASYLLEAGYIKRTREDYDHHVTLTVRGKELLSYHTSSFRSGW